MSAAHPLPAEERRPRLAFLCESGTDVRLVAGLAPRFALTILLRPAFGPVSISWPYQGDAPVEVVEGPKGRLGFTLFAFQWLARRGRGFDLILAQNEALGALAANAARLLTGTRTWLLICSPSLEYFRCRWRKGELSAPRYLLGASVLRASRRLNGWLTQRYVVLSRYLASVVGGGGGGTVSVIPVYGVDTGVFRPLPAGERPALRRRLGLPEDEYLIFFSSRVAPEKDTEGLLQAARRLKERGHRFLLLNLSGGFRDFLRLAEREGVADRVRALEPVHPAEGLPAYYQAADLCVQVSLEEGLGFSPLEALACGVPVVATSVGGLKETIRDGETGLAAPPADPAALAEKLAWAMEHPERMKALAERGRQEVQAAFEAGRCFDALLELARSGG